WSASRRRKSVVRRGPALRANREVATFTDRRRAYQHRTSAIDDAVPFPQRAFTLRAASPAFALAHVFPCSKRTTHLLWDGWELSLDPGESPRFKCIFRIAHDLLLPSSP